MKTSIKFAVLALLLASCCHATLVNQGNFYCNSGSSTTCTLTLGWSPAATNTLIVMCVNYGTGTGLPTVTDSGSHSYAQITTGNGIGTNGIPTVFYYHNIAAGITTVSCTWGSGDYIQTYVVEFSGNLTLDVAATTSFSNSAATHTSSALTALAGDLLFGFISSGGTTDLTPTGGVFTDIQHTTGTAPSGGMSYKQLGTAGSYTVTFDDSGVQPTIIGLIAFTPPGGGGRKRGAIE